MVIPSGAYGFAKRSASPPTLPQSATPSNMRVDGGNNEFGSAGSRSDSTMNNHHEFNRARGAFRHSSLAFPLINSELDRVVSRTGTAFSIASTNISNGERGVVEEVLSSLRRFGQIHPEDVMDALRRVRGLEEFGEAVARAVFNQIVGLSEPVEEFMTIFGPFRQIRKSFFRSAQQFVDNLVKGNLDIRTTKPGLRFVGILCKDGFLDEPSPFLIQFLSKSIHRILEKANRRCSLTSYTDYDDAVRNFLPVIMHLASQKEDYPNLSHSDVHPDILDIMSSISGIVSNSSLPINIRQSLLAIFNQHARRNRLQPIPEDLIQATSRSASVGYFRSGTYASDHGGLNSDQRTISAFANRRIALADSMHSNSGETREYADSGNLDLPSLSRADSRMSEISIMSGSTSISRYQNDRTPSPTRDEFSDLRAFQQSQKSYSSRLVNSELDQNNSSLSRIMSSKCSVSSHVRTQTSISSPSSGPRSQVSHIVPSLSIRSSNVSPIYAMESPIQSRDSTPIAPTPTRSLDTPLFESPVPSSFPGYGYTPGIQLMISDKFQNGNLLLNKELGMIVWDSIRGVPKRLADIEYGDSRTKLVYCVRFGHGERAKFVWSRTWVCYLVELEVLNPQIHVPLMNIMINGGTVEGVALPAATRIVFEEGSHPGGFICQHPSGNAILCLGYHSNDRERLSNFLYHQWNYEDRCTDPIRYLKVNYDDAVEFLDQMPPRKIRGLSLDNGALSVEKIRKMGFLHGDRISVPAINIRPIPEYKKSYISEFQRQNSYMGARFPLSKFQTVATQGLRGILQTGLVVDLDTVDPLFVFLCHIERENGAPQVVVQISGGCVQSLMRHQYKDFPMPTENFRNGMEVGAIVVYPYNEEVHNCGDDHIHHVANRAHAMLPCTEHDFGVPRHVSLFSVDPSFKMVVRLLGWKWEYEVIQQAIRISVRKMIGDYDFIRKNLLSRSGFNKDIVEKAIRDAHRN